MNDTLSKIETGSKKYKSFFLTGLTLLLIVIVAGALRYHKILASNIWLDEAWVFIALFKTDSDYLQLLSIAGFYKFFISICSHIFDMYQLINFRIVSIIFGTLTSMMTYVLASKLSNSKCAFFAAILVAISPLQITYSQDASVYMFCTFLVTLQFLLYCFWVRKFSMKFAIAFALVSLIAINTRPQIVFFTFVLMVSALFISGAITKHKIKSILLATVIMSPSLIAVLEAISFVNLTGEVAKKAIDSEAINSVYQLIGSALFNLPNFVTVYAPRTDITSFYDYLDPIRLGFFALLFGAVIFFLIRKNKLLVILSVSIVFSVVLISYSMLQSAQYFERYLLIFQPLTIVIITTFCGNLYVMERRTLTITIPIGVITLLMWGHFALSSSYGDQITWKPANNNAFNAIKSHLSKDIKSACLVPYFFEWSIARYFLHNEPNVQLQESTFDFFNDLDNAVRLPNEQYLELTLQQVQSVQDDNFEQIFIYTRRGRNMLPDIEQKLAGGYTVSTIYQVGDVVVQRYVQSK